MPTPRLTRRAAETAVAAVNDAIDAGYVRGTENSPFDAAARALNVPRKTLESRLRVARDTYGLQPDWPDDGDVDPVPPAERQDRDFLRRENARLRRELGDLHRILDELGGISGQVDVPKWTASTEGRKGRSVVALLLSDIHYGEVIRPAEIAGINAFDPDICAQRIKRFGSAACVMGTRWAADTNCKGVLLACNGDLISGDIHDELSRTNSLTSIEQVHGCAGLIAGLVEMLLDAFPCVHVVGTPGNHGRTTVRPTAKLYAQLSYDTLILRMVADRFAGDSRVTFQFGAADQSTPIFRETVYTTHGDKLGTGGGQGFAGPVLPIVRGCKKLLEQQDSVGRRPSIIQTAHYHFSANPQLGDVEIFANGSVPGYSEYANGLRAAVETPQQWCYLIHDRWRVRERAKIKLEEPVMPDKPKIRVPAGMT